MGGRLIPHDRSLLRSRPRSLDPSLPHHRLIGPRASPARPLQPGGLGPRSAHTPTDRASCSPGRLIPRAGTLHDPAGTIPRTP
ncbi:hypothetical protein SAMN05216482_2802 [Streptomyces sp. PAN_FS17]|nr:hypothetical protein SAMN05216482_2802 [Streptomyces sp. PAN_FS17]